MRNIAEKKLYPSFNPEKETRIIGWIFGKNINLYFRNNVFKLYCCCGNDKLFLFRMQRHCTFLTFSERKSTISKDSRGAGWKLCVLMQLQNCINNNIIILTKIIFYIILIILNYIQVQSSVLTNLTTKQQATAVWLPSSLNQTLELQFKLIS